MSRGAILIAVLVWLCPSSALAQACTDATSVPATCTSVTKRNATWTFSAAKTAGRFANGDWWVIGPVTVTAIVPAPLTSPGRNGSMLNPTSTIGAQTGFEERTACKPSKPTSCNAPPGYNASLNVALSLPLVVTNESSLLSSESYVNDTDRPGTDDANVPWLKRVEILTVLASQPALDAFRPPYAGSNKTIESQWRVSQINYSKLNTAAPLATTPSLATFQAMLPLSPIELNLEWQGRAQHPYDNSATHPPGYRGGGCTAYGQCMAQSWGAMLLAANLKYSNAQKESIVIRLIQLGIDIYGITRQATPDGVGQLWPANGGHNQGRKMPMVFAGVVLNHTDMIAKSNYASYKYFQEDGSHFYVQQSDIDLVHVACCGRAVAQYTSADLGKPEWGITHLAKPVADNNLWSAFYRDIAGASIAIHVLAAKMMGVQSLWNHPALFDYYEDRLVPAYRTRPGATNKLPTYVRDLWDAYANIAPPGGG